MPHCSRHLYETILQANFNPGLAKQPARVLLGNDLAEYIGFVRMELVERPLDEPSEENASDFKTAKKKRKGKGLRPTPKDGVLERLGESRRYPKPSAHADACSTPHVGLAHELVARNKSTGVRTRIPVIVFSMVTGRQNWCDRLG